MENLILFLQILSLFLLLFLFVWMICHNNEKNKYKRISFEDKKNYLCVYYLYGIKNLKSNIGVLSKDSDNYFLETEDSETTYTFIFRKDEIKNIDIKETTSTSMEDKIIGYSHDFSRSYFSGRSTGEFEKAKAIKVFKVFEITILLNNGITLTLESKKNPNKFF